MNAKINYITFKGTVDSYRIADFVSGAFKYITFILIDDNNNQSKCYISRITINDTIANSIINTLITSMTFALEITAYGQGDSINDYNIINFIELNAPSFES